MPAYLLCSPGFENKLATASAMSSPVLGDGRVCGRWTARLTNHFSGKTLEIIDKIPSHSAGGIVVEAARQ